MYINKIIKILYVNLKKYMASDSKRGPVFFGSAEWRRPPILPRGRQRDVLDEDLLGSEVQHGRCNLLWGRTPDLKGLRHSADPLGGLGGHLSGRLAGPPSRPPGAPGPSKSVSAPHNTPGCKY